MNQALSRPLQLAGLATRVAAARCHPAGASRTAVIDRIVAHLGRMHGLPQKIGQILASADLDTDSRRFDSLTAHTRFALPESEARAWVTHRLGRPLEEVFPEFEARGIAASLGQVHRARLRDGRRVAVKVSYPAIADTLAADLRALGWLASPLGNLRRDFDLDAYRRELGRRLLAELDYAAEAAALRRFEQRTRTWRGAIVPAPVDALCAPGLLVMDWIDGEDIQAAARGSLEERTALAETLLRFFLTGVFHWRELHADPHPGNFRFVRAAAGAPARVAWLDFGSTHEVPAEFSAALRELIAAVANGSLDEVQAWRFHERVGFELKALAPLRAQLPRVLTALLRPFATRGEFDAAAWHPGDELPALLGERRVAYRVAGPPSLLFFIRAFHGLLAQLRALGVPLDWTLALREALPDDASRESSNPHVVAPRIQTAPAGCSGAACAATASTLFVQVHDRGEPHVSLQFHPEAAANLESLVPAELHPTIRERGIDLAKLARHAEATGFATQELFSVTTGERRVRVWLG